MTVKLSDSSDDERFIATVTEGIQGWLHPYTAVRTADLLRWQIENGVKGSLLEIGVFCGKYLSLLLRSGGQTGEKVVGLDLFEATTSDHVNGLLKDAGRPIWLEGKSVDFSYDQVIAALGTNARFISIDGSHSKVDVDYDIALCDQLLSDEGFIAADDFMNCLCMGVMEAILSHLQKSKDTLVPFAYLPNKLLLCRPHMVSNYCDALIKNAIDSTYDDVGERLVKEKTRTGDWAYTELAGSRVLVLS